ncbi:hypothetical protein DER44DRAFT_675932 [Fusarium oxysporum]|nr:hypothetical protein DER44DRAFT_675932 [Fusarium oxysporum]
MHRCLARLQPTPAMQQEGFSEGESVMQIIWSGLSDLRGAGQSAQRRLNADMLRGQLPAIKPLWLLWLQPVKVCTKTENGNGPRLFSLSPKSFRNYPNRPVV